MYGQSYPRTLAIACLIIAAGSHITVNGNVWGGMAPDGDIVLCPFSQSSLGDEDEGDDDAVDENAVSDNPVDDNPVDDEEDEEDEDEDEGMMNIFNGIHFIREYAHREGKPYIISISMNNQDGTHDGTSLAASTFENLIRNGAHMVMASGNEAGDSCYINRQFAENDTLHTILSRDAIAYAYSRQPSEMGCQIGLFNVETKQEEWRSPLLTNKNGNMMLSINYDMDEVKDMGFDNHPEMTYDEMKEALAASAITDDFTNALPIRYGNGKIDAYGGLLHILGIPSCIPELSRHQPQDISFRIDGNRLAIAGAPEGTRIRVYTTAGILITDSALQDGGISLPATAAPGVYAVQVGNYGSTLIRK